MRFFLSICADLMVLGAIVCGYFSLHGDYPALGLLVACFCSFLAGVCTIAAELLSRPTGERR